MTKVIETFSGQYRPVKPFKGYKKEEECSNPGLILGLELEIEAVRMDTDQLESRCRALGIDIKTDGSLRTVDGLPAWEFVTKPIEMKHALPALREFYSLNNFNERNFSDRTSIHVHTDCQNLEWPQLANISLAYTVLEEVLFEFVNDRPGSRDGYSRDTNLYCVPWNQCRDHYNLIQQFLSNPFEGTSRWQKYTALNLAPLHRQGTIEWRHMHGTADMTKIATWINIIGSIIKYATSLPHEALVKEIISLNTVSHYAEFFRTVTGGYLPYNDVYRSKLEEGTIFAKYSLMTSRKSIKKPETAQAAPAVAPGHATDALRMQEQMLQAERNALNSRALEEAINRIRPADSILTGTRAGRMPPRNAPRATEGVRQQAQPAAPMVEGWWPEPLRAVDFGPAEEEGEF